MNPIKPLLPLGAALLATLSLQASPFKPSQISNQANWFVHADLDVLRDTSVGKIVMDTIEKEHGAQLKAVKRMFSLNPFTDLHGITLAGSGEKDKAVALIHASFDREHLEDIIGGTDDYSTSESHGNTIHSWKDKDKDKVQFGAFFGEDLIIISEQKDFVQITLDVLTQRSPSLPPDTVRGDSAFLLGLANLENLDIQGEEAKLFEKAKALQARFFEKDDRLHAELIIEATNHTEAVRFRKVLDGIVALGELTNDDIAKLQLKTSVSIQNNTQVTATLSVPNTLVLDLLKQAADLQKSVTN